MDSVGQRLDLMQTGTRYDHYTELKEIFALGVEVINNMRPGIASEGDKRMKVKLEAAVELIEKRLLYLADYENQSWKTNREIRLALTENCRKQLTGGGDAKVEQKSSGVVGGGQNQGSAPSASDSIKGGWPEATAPGDGSV